MNGLLVAGLILGIGAPAPKEGAKKGASLLTIVGEWHVTAMIIAGEATPVKSEETVEFTLDGNMTFRGTNTAAPPHRYKTDNSKEMAEFDLILTARAGKEFTLKGIYKLDGKTLIVCVEDGGNRAKKFESLKGTNTIMWTLKRVEKKKE